jgi:hypothetical protein
MGRAASPGVGWRIVMIKKILVVAVALAALLTVATVASADHSWSVYHWSSDNLSPTVVDRTSSDLYQVGPAVDEWAYQDEALTIQRSNIQPTLTTARKGDITVREAFSQSWLGLARIFIDENGHITKGEVKLNTQSLDYYEANGYPGIADHVLCQEIGHVLGLGHNRTQNDTCMNDQAFIGPDLTSPNTHDTDQLNAIYNHTDAAPGGSTDEGGPDCSKNSKAKQCRSGNGFWITVHVFPTP